MADGNRSVRSAKYELPVYNLTNKTKYAIGSINLIALTEGILSDEQRVRLTANRFINLQGGTMIFRHKPLYAYHRLRNKIF